MKGQGLAKLMAEENCDLLRMNFIGISLANMQTEVAAEAEVELVQEQHDSQQVT